MEPTHLPLNIYEHRAHGLPTRRLELMCRITNPAPFPLCILDAWLKVEALNGLFLAEGRIFYTTYNRIEAAVIPSAEPGFGSIVIPLPPLAIQHLEQRRKGSDLTLRISSRVRACPLHIQDDKQVLGAPFETQLGDRHSVYLEYTIPQSDWIKDLRALGWSELELLEIPSAKIASSPQLVRAYQRFEDALEAYRRGDWDGTMINCRKAFEAIVKDTTKKDDLSEAQAAYRELISEPEKADPINKVVNDFTPFLHLARHEQMPPVPIKPKDAMLALHVTGSLLIYLVDK